MSDYYRNLGEVRPKAARAARQQLGHGHGASVRPRPQPAGARADVPDKQSKEASMGEMNELNDTRPDLMENQATRLLHDLDKANSVAGIVAQLIMRAEAAPTAGKRKWVDAANAVTDSLAVRRIRYPNEPSIEWTEYADDSSLSYTPEGLIVRLIDEDEHGDREMLR